jgi:hypothetical protein
MGFLLFLTGVFLAIWLGFTEWHYAVTNRRAMFVTEGLLPRFREVNHSEHPPHRALPGSIIFGKLDGPKFGFGSIGIAEVQNVLRAIESRARDQ